MIFSRAGADVCIDTATRLDRAFVEVGIERHAGKDIDGALSATAIGIDVVDGLALWASDFKLRLLLPGLLHVLERERLTPLQMSALLGHIQWFDLLNRCLFSLLHFCYGFARNVPQNVTTQLPHNCLVELASVVALASHWSFLMTKPWLPVLLASDVSPSYGFGVTMCRTSVDRV